MVDATPLKGLSMVPFPKGTTVGEAVGELGLAVDPLGSGFCLPRAGILYRALDGWSIRPMTQRERWVWRIPMDLYNCGPQDLERISGIGTSLAGRIHRYVQGRGYLMSVSDLDSVPGVGPGKLEALRKDLALN